jgi:hypothetical protein
VRRIGRRCALNFRTRNGTLIGRDPRRMTAAELQAMWRVVAIGMAVEAKTKQPASAPPGRHSTRLAHVL